MVMAGSKIELKSSRRCGWLQEQGRRLGDRRPEAEVLLSFAVKTDSVGLLFMKDTVCNSQHVNTSLKCRFKKLQFRSQSFKQYK